MYCLEVLEEMNQRMTEAGPIGCLSQFLEQGPDRDGFRHALIHFLKHFQTVHAPSSLSASLFSEPGSLPNLGQSS